MGYIFEVSIIQSGWALNEDDDTAGGQFDNLVNFHGFSGVCECFRIFM